MDKSGIFDDSGTKNESIIAVSEWKYLVILMSVVPYNSQGAR